MTHIAASVLPLRLVICLADCKVSICSGHLFLLEKNHKALTPPFDLQVTQIKIQRGVSRDVNIVHYSLNPEMHISI